MWLALTTTIGPCGAGFFRLDPKDNNEDDFMRPVKRALEAVKKKLNVRRAIPQA